MSTVKIILTLALFHIAEASTDGYRPPSKIKCSPRKNLEWDYEVKQCRIGANQDCSDPDYTCITGTKCSATDKKCECEGGTIYDSNKKTCGAKKLREFQICDPNNNACEVGRICKVPEGGGLARCVCDELENMFYDPRSGECRIAYGQPCGKALGSDAEANLKLCKTGLTCVNVCECRGKDLEYYWNIKECLLRYFSPGCKGDVECPPFSICDRGICICDESMGTVKDSNGECRKRHGQLCQLPATAGNQHYSKLECKSDLVCRETSYTTPRNMGICQYKGSRSSRNRNSKYRNRYDGKYNGNEDSGSSFSQTIFWFIIIVLIIAAIVIGIVLIILWFRRHQAAEAQIAAAPPPAAPAAPVEPAAPA